LQSGWQPIRYRATTIESATIAPLTCFVAYRPMTPFASQRVADRVRLLVPIVVLLCAWAPGAASAARHGAGAPHASQYPAGAERPAIPVRASRLVHAAKPALPGTPAPPANPVKPTKPAAKPVKKPAKPGLHGNPARALLAFKMMQQYFYIQGRGLYKGEPYSFLWPFSQALAANVSLAYIPGESKAQAHELQVRMFGLEKYFEAPPASSASEPSNAPQLPSFAGSVVAPLGPGGASYFDDNEWVGIELMRMYELDHEAFALGLAKQIMAFVMAGWETTKPGGQPLPCPGGVPFSNSPENSSRNAVTDGPAAELGVQLYRATHEPQYLQFAERAYTWVRQCLLNGEGLYADHIQNSGEVEPMVWSYNQGSMIGAGALLYQVTGNGEYLLEARYTAQAAQAHFGLEKLELENPFFVSVYYRNLLYLDSIVHDASGPRVVQEYVNYAWQNLRLENDLFVSGSPSTSTLLGQAAMVQLYALLSIPPSAYF
jgi:Glycosyl hydrolase family 76